MLSFCFTQKPKITWKGNAGEFYLLKKPIDFKPLVFWGQSLTALKTVLPQDSQTEVLHLVCLNGAIFSWECSIKASPKYKTWSGLMK